MQLSFIEFFNSDMITTIPLILLYLSFYTYHLGYKFKKLLETNMFRTVNYKIQTQPSFLNIYTYALILILLLLKKQYNSTNLAWYDHLIVSNFNYTITFISYILIFFILIKELSNKKNHTNRNSETILAFFLFTYTLQLLLYTNNLFSFIVLLEFQSLCLMYYLLTSSNFISNKFLKKNETLSYLNEYSQNVTYSILFNYWMAFFGSILLVYSLISIEKTYGFIDWSSLNILFMFEMKQVSQTANFIWILYWFPLFLGFLIKLGYAPVYLWKPEFYKGLSYSTLFFFMTVYFFLFFITFSVIFFKQLSSLNYVWINYITIFTTITALSIIFAIFDLSTLKSFLGYGTIMHTTFMLSSLNNLV